ncbi:bifunctional precorrin-2 dehydrogenase/sirohydrochlorin ferrochelatase [Listeria grandensis]|uniref:precorrin-2 dehydrogenase/sirohydrochlorin ferrochelatase family protein n=1 Tax=Listeria grandensis TaxID=1494963 RepID=UPI00162418E5|nr:bifunctional precorrin-2 dehydrogenase/sirohydrochlorin ferrochelatase [Listeria grandensis]MBC1475281.1 bifunctional precorrin-2 dehydrogenase/sirohydrochlorin ferrochelatase [Listeria grandensis]
MTTIGYPILLQLADKNVAIIGGGKIATRKAQGLLPTGANITVIAPTFTKALQEMPITRIQENYHAAHIKDAFLIFCCTDDPEINTRVTTDATATQLVNDCSNKTRSDFFNMATIRKTDHLIAISTDGTDPARSKNIRTKIEQNTEF